MQLFTQFPIDTPAPQIQVALPVGKHTLQLKVQDDAGEWSDPVTVVVDVVRKQTGTPPPQIDTIAPDTLLWKLGQQWFKQEVTVKGTNLDQLTEVLFDYDEQKGVGGLKIGHNVAYLLQPNGTAARVDGVEDRIRLVAWSYVAPTLKLTIEIGNGATSEDHGAITVGNASGRSQSQPFFVNQKQ
jgi:hypothetical protein